MLDRYYVYTTTEYARKEGYKDGVAEGKVAGKAEEKESIARNLLKLGVSLEIIAKASGLFEEAITALK